MSSSASACKWEHLLCLVNALIIQADNLSAKAGRKNKRRLTVPWPYGQNAILHSWSFVCFFVGSFTCGAFGFLGLKAQFSFSRLFKYLPPLPFPSHHTSNWRREHLSSVRLEDALSEWVTNICSWIKTGALGRWEHVFQPQFGIGDEVITEPWLPWGREEGDCFLIEETARHLR